jgi:hypothetical protein
VKAKTVPEERRGEPGIGDAWTWTALDPDTKLMCSWLVGERSPEDAEAFMADLAGRLAHRVQITTDGFPAYVSAIAAAFGSAAQFCSDPYERVGSAPLVVGEHVTGTVALLSTGPSSAARRPGAAGLDPRAPFDAVADQRRRLRPDAQGLRQLAGGRGSRPGRGAADAPQAPWPDHRAGGALETPRRAQST